MTLDQAALNQLADLAAQAAIRAGEYIATSSQQELEVMHKEGGDSLASQVLTEVDENAQALILEVLEPSFGKVDLALLPEEAADEGSRLKKDYFWCIDPLDGTLPFTQGIPGYSVSIALVRRDGEPKIGVIYDPVKERLYRVVRGSGIEINGSPWFAPRALGNETQLRFCCDCTFASDPDRTRLTAEMEQFAREQGFAEASVHIGGGAVLNACYVLEHPPAIYFKRPKPKLGGGAYWDFAATACLFAEAGAHATDFSGKRLELNRPGGTFMNHCGVCYSTDAALAKPLIDRG